MPSVRLGTNSTTNIKLGVTQLQKVYGGTSLIWSGPTSAPSYITPTLFTGTTGTAWPAPWTTAGGTRTIQSNWGRLAPGAAGYAYSRAHTTGLDIANVRLTGEFRINTLSEQYPVLHVRHNGAWNAGVADKSIALYLDIAGNSVDIQMFDAGAYVASVGAPASITWATNTRYRFTLEVIEGSGVTYCRTKVWAAVPWASEPETWSINGSTTNSVRATSGGAALVIVSGDSDASSYFEFDDLLIQDLGNTRLQVLAIGDSITAGPYNHPDYPAVATWRKYVYEAKNVTAFPVSFVGQNWSCGVADGSGNLGGYAGMGTWDVDHHARNSWTVTQAGATAPADVTNYQPDVAILYIGLNDLGDAPADVSGRIGTLIDNLRAAKSNLRFVLCQLAPASAYGSAVTTLNGLLATLASTKTTALSPIVLADCNTGFNAGWVYDGLHFNDAGDQFVAGKIIAALSEFDSYVPPDLVVPGVPTGLGAVAGNGQVTLTWTAPVVVGTGLTNYSVQWRTTAGPGSWNTFTHGSTATTSTVTGLTNATSYDFQVAAINATGTGAYTSPVTATPIAITVPGAPTLNTATAGNLQVALAWTAGSTGGSAITDYVIEKSADGTSGWTVVTESVSTTPSYTVTGLTNGTIQYFRVSAVNTIGTGTASNVMSATPLTVPGAPTGLGATAGVATAALTWTAPASNGGAAITDYTVQWRTTAGPGAWNTFSHAASTATAITVTGLTNGTGYDFQVAAVNLAGAGSYSTTASATPNVTYPVVAAQNSEFGTSMGTQVISMPTGIAAGNLLIAIAASDLNGSAGTHAPSTGWTEIRTQLQGTNVVRLSAFGRIADGTATDNLTITGPSQDYLAWTGRIAIHTVTAISEIVVADATAATGNGDPPNLNPAVARAWLWLAAEAVDLTNSSVITSVPSGYTEVYRNVSASSTTSVALGVGSKTGDTTSENPGTFTNNPTTRPWVAFTIGIPNLALVPSAPTLSTATPGTGQVALVWTAPTALNGSAISDYVVEYRLSPAGTWTPFSHAASTALGITVTGLTSGTAYDFRVSAVNSAGAGAVSNSLTATPVALTAPSAPTLVSATPGNTTAALTWTAPSSNGGSAITGYLVEKSPNGTSSWTTAATLGVVLTYTVTGLTNGTIQHFRVSAINSIGTGTASNVLSTTPAAGGALYTDDFNRANGALTSPWVGMEGTHSISGNKVGGGTLDPTISYYNQTFSADQWVEFDVIAFDSSAIVTPCIRVNSATGDFYYLWRSFGGSDYISIAKRAGGSYSTFSLTSVLAPSIPNFKCRMEAEGTTLRIYIDGALIHTVTDSSIATGRPGMLGFATVTGGLDNFRCGDLPYTSG